MRQIGSSAPSCYHVFIRGLDKPIRLDAAKGSQLSSYLTGKEVAAFVELNDIAGVRRVIRTVTIDRVEAASDPMRYKTAAELGMGAPTTELSDEERETNLGRLREMRGRLMAARSDNKKSLQ